MRWTQLRGTATLRSPINKETCVKATVKLFRILGAIVFVLFRVSAPQTASATNSTTFWTPMTPDVQPYGVLHLGMDNYFRLGQGSPGTLPTDFTVATIGVLPFKKLQMEVGIDYFATTGHPWLFNAKIGTPENAWFKGQPALQVGISNAQKRFQTNRADTNILFAVIGKTIPKIGRFSIGPYLGNHATLVSSAGKGDNFGFMAAFDRGFLPAKGSDGEYNKLVFAIDYASGENALGGGGGGFYYYFTKDISLLVGPTFFNDRGINGRWKLTTQLDVNLNLLKLFGKRGH